MVTLIKCAGTVGNGDDEDGDGSVCGGTTGAEEVETQGDTTGDVGGIEGVAEDAYRRGAAVGDVEDDDGVRGCVNGLCGMGGGLLDGPVSSLTLSVRELIKWYGDHLCL